MPWHGRSSTGRTAATLLSVVVAVATCQQSAESPDPSQGTSVPPSAAATASPATAPACDPSPTVATRPWWADEVFYEVFVRSFQDADGDGIGDLAGLTARLDQLNDGDPATTDDLGITALWLMPVAESPSYHGYDVVDYRAVESDYGTAEDFAAFIAEAHERGIKVIVDLVMNHTSREHPWFRDALTPGSEHEDWYLWSPDRPFARSDGARVWHEAAPGRYYYGYFWEGMPDLNLENPDVTAELDAIAAFWLDDMGVDGFRLDAARHLIEDGDEVENTEATFAWLEAFRGRLQADHPEALILGEVWDITANASRYVTEGSLDLTFDFGLASATITALNSRTGGPLVTALRDVAESYPLDGLATFLSNHDQNRVATQLSADAGALRLAATLLLAGPGVPFVYYGEEIGMTGAKPDERIRTPMRWDGSSPAAGFSTAAPWQALSLDPAGTDVAAESADPESILSAYRDLIRLRLGHPALAAGSVVPVTAADTEVVAFLRVDGDRAALVVANLGARAVPSPSLDLAAGPLCGSTTATSLLGPGAVAPPTVTADGGFRAYVPVPELGPREALVIDLESR